MTVDGMDDTDGHALFMKSLLLHFRATAFFVLAPPPIMGRLLLLTCQLCFEITKVG
jgi:hypothetical protein